MIEAILYIGLFSIIMGGLLVAAFAMLEATAEIETDILVNEESNFLISKVSRLIADAYSITAPNISTPTSTSLVVLLTATSTPITIQLDSTNMVWSVGATDTILNDTGVKVADLKFEYFLPDPDLNPAVKASFKVNNKPFSIFRYKRQS